MKKSTIITITDSYLVKQVLILFLIVCACALQKTKAQKITTNACTVNGITNGISVPFDLCGDGATTTYSAAADLYLSSEICYGTISAIQFYVTYTWGSAGFPVKIYMKTQAGTTLTADTYSNMLAGATLVYTNASQSWLPAGSVPGYQTFTLTTPFSYTTGNLIIICEQDCGTNYCGTNPVFGYGIKANTDEYWWSSSSAANLLPSTGTVDQYRPGINFSSIAILPVKLLSFTGENPNGKTLLRWKTATETNNDYFTIERSEDAKTWNEIGKVKGEDNSSTEKNYEYTDEFPYEYLNGKEFSNDVMYYRLKQTDYNGQYEYYDPLSVSLASQDELQLIMQTFSNNEFLSGTLFTRENASAQIEIIDLQGRIIHTEIFHAVKGINTMQIDLNNVKAGIYFFKINDGINFAIKKFVKT